MNKSPVPVQETSTFIHQRYEDAAHLIFQQQQKQWKRELKSRHKQPEPDAEVEFAHYGNPGVIARAEAAERLASFTEKSPGKKGGKDKKKEDKDSKKEKKEKEKEEKALKKEEKTRSSKREKSFRGLKGKEKEGSLRRSDSEKGAHVGEVFRDKYTPLASPSLAHNNHRDLSLPSPKDNSFSSENSSLSNTPRRVNSSQKLPYASELKNKIQERSRLTSAEFSSAAIPYSPNDTGVPTPESIAEAPRETVIGAEAAPESLAAASEKTVVKRLESDFDSGEGRVSLERGLGFEAVSNPYIASEGVDLDDETFESEEYPPSYSVDVRKESDPDVGNKEIERVEELLEVEKKLVLSANGTDTDIGETFPGPSGLHKDSPEPKPDLLEDSPEQNTEDPLEQNPDQEKLDLEKEDSIVDFGHYGNTGIIAKKQAVARAASILRKDREVTESKVCALM